MLLKIMALWMVSSSAILFVYARRELIAAWREPVLRRPVLIIESDDWGAGPARQADALREIASLLAEFSDDKGNPPVMTLGMVLASADGEKTVASGNYQRQTISPETHKALLDTIHEGVARGVFSTQLHGLEHYWPEALMTASNAEAAVKSWLLRAPEAPIEDLPSPLQSRWVDASILPACSLACAEVESAAHQEIDAYQLIFGEVPRVVVPPTFIWNESVEQAWADAGVEVVITPGRRFETRDEQGKPAGGKETIFNGQIGKNGILYLVRDVYFEPSIGHTAAQALLAFEIKTRNGRPVLFETHRFNFLGQEQQRTRALAALRELLTRVLENHPRLSFLSTEKLAQILRHRDPEWVEQEPGCRLHVWLNRLGDFTRLRKLAWLSGLIVPAWLVWKLTG